LAAAEPMNRSRKLDMSSTETSSNGAGSSIARSTSAPSMARIGPSRDQLNIATKWAAKNTKAMYGASVLMPSIIIGSTSR
jgi:hypothetical protein